MDDLGQKPFTQHELEDEIERVSAELRAAAPGSPEEESLVWEAMTYAGALMATAERAERGEGPPPERRTVARWTHTQDNITVRQGGEEDLPAVHALIDQVRNPEVVAYLHRAADEWWSLDRAVPLLVYEGTELRCARMIRHRRDTEASSIFLGPADDAESTCMKIGIDLTKEWLRGAGYTAVSSFVPERRLPKLEPLLRHAGGRVVGRREFPRGPFIEYRIPV